MDKLKTLFRKWAQRGLIGLAGFMGLHVFNAALWHNPIQMEHWRGSELIGVYNTVNGIVDVGINHMLETEFNAGTQVTTWYMGLVDNSGFTAFDNGDTMASHTGWNEFTTYSEATRPIWNPDAAASRSISNGTSTDFSINGSGTVKGIFVTTNNTKSGTTGTLWATAAFASNVTVSNGDILKVTYTISG